MRPVFILAVFLGAASSAILFPRGVLAADVVEDLKEKVSDLKTSLKKADSSNGDFALEQKEFDRMRQELLAAEEAILAKTPPATTVNADHEYKTEIDPQQIDRVNKLSAPTQVRAKGDFQEVEEFENGVEEAKEAIDSSNNELQSIKSKYEVSQAQLISKNQDIKSLRVAQSAAEQEANTAKQKIAALQKELQTAKNKLLVSEAEVERLSKLAGSGSNNARLPAAAMLNEHSATTTTDSQQMKPKSSSLIVTVIANKATLRSAPNGNSSSLMEVKSGVQLVVENKQANWLRVSTPTGIKGWITADLVAADSADPTRSLQAVAAQSYKQGVDSQDEDKAFELIQQHSR